MLIYLLPKDLKQITTYHLSHLYISLATNLNFKLIINYIDHHKITYQKFNTKSQITKRTTAISFKSTDFKLTLKLTGMQNKQILCKMLGVS